jgi:Superinfection exclusion gene product 17
MQLKVSWFPQIPCESFDVAVGSVADGVKIMDVLAGYDAFQSKHGIKPDYCNAGSLQMFDASDDTDSPEGSWVDWCDEESGEDDPRVFLESQASSR